MFEKLVDAIPGSLSGVSFQLYTSEEIKKLSVLEVTNPVTFDALGHTTNGGLCDSALGPADRFEVCKTCNTGVNECNGHYGHLSLALPVFNPILIRHTYQLLKMTCFECNHFLFPMVSFEVVIAQLKALESGLDYLVDELQELSTLLLKDGAVNNESVTVIIREKLKERIEAELMILQRVSGKQNGQVKNVVERRQKLFKELIMGKLIKPTKVCAHCAAKKKNVTIVNNSVVMISVPKRPSQVPSVNLDEIDRDGEEVMETSVKELSFEVSGKSYLTPLEARTHLRELWKHESKALKTIFGIFGHEEKGEHAVDIFFLDTVLVSPNRFRPLRHVNGKKFENERTSLLNQIMLASSALQVALKNVKEGGEQSGKTDKSNLVAQLHYSWQKLQILCNRLYDNEMDRSLDKKLPGVKQILEKKEGLFRKHMMGKRVNYAARSVISPDPYIMADEVGMPQIFAMKLTYPEVVTPWNAEKLREAIINGPNKHPGAVSVQLDSGQVYRLKADDENQRRQLADRIYRSSGPYSTGPKIVNRHLISGDVLLLNRQPTLHKPSIMAHKARVLPREKTMRLHYANCKCYNADFDGDEMNAHFPQSELARAEAYTIANVDQQFLVPKDGTPLSGLIQDHIIGAALLSIRGSHFDHADYNELVYGALSFLGRKLKLLPPAMLKPVRLWSGKQIVSTIILNIVPDDKQAPSLEIASKVRPKSFVRRRPLEYDYFSTVQPGELCESEVIIRNGELLCGILDKANIGPTPYGLIHCCYELYGGKVSNALLTSFARLATNFLQMVSGFTLGIMDILVQDESNRERRRLMQLSQESGDKVAAEALNVVDYKDKDVLVQKLQDAHISKDPSLMKQLDRIMKEQTDETNNNISKTCLPGLLKKFPENNLQFMIQAGAKGGTVNALQISCLLGQIELEGRRVPLMMSGRTLPSFVPYETSPRAGGFVSGRFLTGIRPQEFFFHCMAGREGLIDTAVKTSRSGYLQRCLIKHLEGLVVNYDMTVRDSDGSVVQFQYGEDGLDVLKSQLLKKEALPILIRNYPSLKSEDRHKMKKLRDKSTLQELGAQIKDWEDANGEDRLARRHGSVFQEYVEEMKKQIEEEFKAKGKDVQLNDYKTIIDSWFKLDREERRSVNRYWGPCPGPVTSVLRPDSNWGAVSEKLMDLVKSYSDKNPDHLLCDHEESKEKRGKNKELERWRKLYRPPLTSNKFRHLIYDHYIKSLCQPGEAVGLLSAQSVGEPSTQMTLNTFHFAGRGEMNVTLGIPRLREIIMTASPNIATPSMDIPFLQKNDQDMDEIANQMRVKLNSVRLSDVLNHAEVEETVAIENGVCYRSYEIKFHFLNREYYEDNANVDSAYILGYMEAKFFTILLEAIAKKMRNQKKYNSLYDHSAIIREKKTAGGDDDNDEENFENIRQKTNVGDDDEGMSSDEEENNADEDTTASKSKSRHDQDLGYEEPEEVELENQHSDVEFDAPDDDGVMDSFKAKDVDQDIEVQDVAEDDKQEKRKKKKKIIINNKGKSSKGLKVSELEKDQRINTVLNLDSNVKGYDLDTERQEWCTLLLRFELSGSKIDMARLIEEEAKRCRIYKVGKIEKAFLVKDPEASKRGLPFEKMLKTEGVSFSHVVRFADILDLKRIYSNDIHAIATTYGIEAARRAIQIEVTNVFAVYGIHVDPRHLSLIADYMTFDGKIKGMNRMSMTMNSSPIQQMTFETTTTFLKTAIMLGLRDEFNSPSARIFAGVPPAGGTGCLSLLQKKVELPPKYKTTQEQSFKRKSVSWFDSPQSKCNTPMSSNKTFKRDISIVDKNLVNKRIKFTD